MALNRIVSQYIDGHNAAVRALEAIADDIVHVAGKLVAVLQAGGKILVLGNGGSAADAQHLAAELVGRFESTRRGWPAIALSTDSSILTAVSNDFGYDAVFSRQVEALATAGDAVIGISTSGNSPNVIRAMQAAAAKGCLTVGLLGRDGGELARQVESPLTVAVQRTAHIQEVHAMIIHLLCQLVDDALSAD